MTEHIAAKAQLTERTDYLTWLEKSGVKPGRHHLRGNHGQRRPGEDAGGEQFLDADTVIIAAGTRLWKRNAISSPTLPLT